MNGTRCIGCGCTEGLPCTGQLTETGTCFWTWVSDDDRSGLCSACAPKPIEELERRMKVAA